MRSNLTAPVASRRPFWLKVARTAIAGVVSIVALLLVWTLIAIRARPEARAALTSSSEVTVVHESTHVIFSPARHASATGLVFFAGALVDPVAYAPILRRVADAGHPGILVKLPRRGFLGGLDGADVLTRATSAMARVEGVERWILAGHSLGGGVAARLARTNESVFGGLVLIGSSDPRDFSLAATTLAVTQIYGTHDGVESQERIARNLANLPISTRRIRIDGGNHSQFAYYGLQPGDWPATITREEQQRLLMRALLDALGPTEG